MGEICTKGYSFRARAEARQRKYRNDHLKVEYERYGHILKDRDAKHGKNLIREDIFCAALKRQMAGKGVAFRTFNNMLSSQAMCFNIFGPLTHDLVLATKILGKFLPISEVSYIEIEYTPDKEVLRDQSGRGGVDCDVLIIARHRDGSDMVIAVETKFVEKEFSVCGFRKPSKKGDICPPDISLKHDKSNCLYTWKKKYLYWKHTDEHNMLKEGKVGPYTCPFSGPMWQLWVNRVLAAAEASHRGIEKSMFTVIAPKGNEALLKNNILGEFRSLLRNPEEFVFIDLEDILSAIQSEVGPDDSWANALTGRYQGI